MPAASEQPPVKLSLPLQFQQDIYNQLRAEDVLIILARGLGLLKIVTNLLHAYDVAGNSLVIVVGAEDRENEWIGEALAEHHATSRSPLSRGLRVINTDKASVTTREKIYADGGIVSVTSRILVVDLLSKVLDPETVTGLVILHAERVVATSVEAFIIRIFRQFNKIGFLKAFCDAPEPLNSVYAPLASMMKNLFLRRPAIWPRFHSSVAHSLEGRKKAEIIELEIPMSDSMEIIQNAVIECVEASIRELRKSNAGVDMDDWNADSALHTHFDGVIRRQLDPVWHRVSWRTKEIVNDLTTLRSILHALLSYDCVSLLKYLDTVLATHTPPPGSTKQTRSPWLFLDAANTIFQTAKDRVYSGNFRDKDTLPAGSRLPDSLEPALEEQPKWAQLAEILEEIETDMYYNPQPRGDDHNTVLIMANDHRQCCQIREYLECMHIKPRPEDVSNGAAPHRQEIEDSKPSAEFMLRRKLREYLNWKKTFSIVSNQLYEANQRSLVDIKSNGINPRLGNKAPPNKRRRLRGGGNLNLSGRSPSGAGAATGDNSAQVAALLSDLRPTLAGANAKDEGIIDDLADATDDFFQLYEPDDQIVVHPYDGDSDDMLLEEVRPRYIIMYSPSTDFVRRVEVYTNSHTARHIRVYFMLYKTSVEEQRYFSSVRREKDAFTKLIKERGSMALTLADAGALDPQEAFLRTVNTRIAGGGRLAATAVPPAVVVDVREFRSALPSLLHGRNMQVVPCQLTVGDYVLSTEIAVERKSISDLIQSFKSGRLFNQAETILQHYKYSFLLIEFDQNKSFTLDPFADLSSSLSNLKIPDSETRDLQSKLVLLTLAFPRLKIIWSSSPFQTAQIFEELKKGQEEPDPLRAVSIGLEDGEDPDERTFNAVPQDLLRTVPGVTGSIAQKLILECRDLREVASMSVDELDPLIGREAARVMVRFFTRSVFDDELLAEGATS